MHPSLIDYMMTVKYLPGIFLLIPQFQHPGSLQSVNNLSDLCKYPINWNFLLFVSLASKEQCWFAPVDTLA